MKIAILARTVYPIRKPFYGGMEMNTYTLAEELTRRGHDVTLYAAKGSDPQFNTVEVVRPTQAVEPEWRQFGQRVRYYLRDRQTQLTFVNVVSDIARQGFDVIHNNSLLTLPVKHASHLGIPVVTTLHVPPVREIKKAMAACAKLPLHRTVTVSHSNAALWAKVLDHKPDVIHNGINLDKWKHKSMLPDHKFAVWVGRITPEKGLEYAIEAARKADIDLKVIGPVVDETYFDKKIQPQLDDRITYYGHLSHEIINHITLTASVVIVSSVWDEPFGLVVIEALASGTPVAAFRSGALPEIVSPITGELATAKDTDGLARAIRTCASKEPLKCREMVQRQFSINTMIDNYEAAYRALLYLKPSRRGVPQWALRST